MDHQLDSCTNPPLFSLSMDKPKKVRPVRAQRIRDLREARGLSMEGLARIVGVSKTTVQNWEEGKGGGGLQGDNLLALASALGVAPDELAQAGDKQAALERDVIYASLRAFLERATKPQGITGEERDYLASYRFPRGIDNANDGWWLNQLYLYRNLQIQSPSQVPAEVEPPKPRKHR